jgi:hypothetical protein
MLSAMKALAVENFRIATGDQVASASLIAFQGFFGAMHATGAPF